MQFCDKIVFFQAVMINDADEPDKTGISSIHCDQTGMNGQSCVLDIQYFSFLAKRLIDAFLTEIADDFSILPSSAKEDFIYILQINQYFNM